MITLFPTGINLNLVYEGKRYYSFLGIMFGIILSIAAISGERENERNVKKKLSDYFVA